MKTDTGDDVGDEYGLRVFILVHPYRRPLAFTGVLVPNNFGHMAREAVVQGIADSAFQRRCPDWTEGIAVGSERYVEDALDGLGFKARYRTKAAGGDDVHVLRESPGSYRHLGLTNSLQWRIIAALTCGADGKPPA
ncbi:MAG: hypothetical protein GXP31_11950 [Kiritimatiellaeota bacterium]|nr:hypothetical protein [Kiritimatiellota bacterium]